MSIRTTLRGFLASSPSIVFRRAISSLLIISLGHALHAQPTTAVGFLAQSLGDLCHGIQDLIPTTAMMLVMFAAVIYASGQFFGAETRARANVWATSCITGAIIGIIISTVAPDILSQLAGEAVSC
jgi:hypothetical protein